MISGEDDRPTVDLGPRPATEEAAASTDLGDDTVGADPVHALPTQALPSRKKSSTESHQTRITTTTSPVEAMKLEEIARSQVFLRVVILTCFAGVLVAVATGGDPVAFRVVMGGCILTTVGALWMLVVLRDPATYTARKLVGPALVIALGAFGGVFYWGPASPVSAMIAYGIYFFSLGSSVRVITGLYVLVSLLHAALALAIMGGVIVDRGIVNMQHLRTMDQIGILAVVEFLYFITFYTARVSQRVTLDHVSKLEQAVRGVAQREALLAEARAELDRAIAVGGPGRFTDQQVGNFRLGVLIGRGGMGEVYEAHAVTDQREAAVKLLHPGTLAEPVHVQRFLREAQTAAKLDCPHVVRVLEVGTTSGTIPFLAMERLRGYDLAHQLRRQRKIQLQQAKLLVDQVAIGLEAARVAGIVHRDLKPHNVFFSEEPGGLRRWKILDFGVSKSGSSGTLTQGHVVGTPAYMAPEQARGEDVDHRADVYSLAAIIYRSVTGHPAFTGKDVPTTLYEVVYRIPTQPSLLAQVTADIDRVLAIGLAKDPRDRFAFALELARWFSAAVTQGLDVDQRRRADDLIARYPWSARLGLPAGA